MNFTKWCKMATGYSWSELKKHGMTQEQRYSLYDDYQEYCDSNNIVAEIFFGDPDNYDWRKNKRKEK